MAEKGLSRAAKRIQRQLKDILHSKDLFECGITLETVNENFLDLRAEIIGPPDTPYERGKFILQLKVPESFPFKPIGVKFLTKVWHPNVSSVTGAICLNILKEDWVPCISLRIVLISLQALLSAAEPDNPQDAVVAKQYTENQEIFKLTAEHWTRVYAGAPGSNAEFEHMIRSLVNIGVDEEEALAALSCSSWDLTKATDLIFR